MKLIMIGASLFSAYISSDLFGKLIFWMLFILSLITWTLFLQKFLLMQKVKRESKKTENHLLKSSNSLLESKLKEAEKVAPYTKVFEELQKKAKELLSKNHFFSQQKQQVFLSSSDMELLESYTYSYAQKFSNAIEKNLFLLPTTVTLAPFLGLLGTVWGILTTFSELQNSSMGLANKAVLSGLSMALATTVVGLLVAIPALIANNYLKNSIKEFKKDLMHFSQQLLIRLEMEYRKVDFE